MNQENVNLKENTAHTVVIDIDLVPIKYCMYHIHFTYFLNLGIYCIFHHIGIDYSRKHIK